MALADFCRSLHPETGASPSQSRANICQRTFSPPRSPSDAGSSRTDADASILLASGLHFNSSPGRRLTCPGLSSSHDPCVCPRDQRFHLRKSVPLNISVSHPRQRETEKKKHIRTLPSWICWSRVWTARRGERLCCPASCSAMASPHGLKKRKENPLHHLSFQRKCSVYNVQTPR